MIYNGPSIDELFRSEELKYGNDPYIVDVEERTKRYKANIHAVNILQIFGFNKWLRTYEDFENKTPFPTISLRDFVTYTHMFKKYIIDNSNDFSYLYRYDEVASINIHPINKIEKKEPENLFITRKFINRILSDTFDMKLLISKDRLGYELISKWQLDKDGYIRPIGVNPYE